MFSFYVVTPAGFQLEFGYGADDRRAVDREPSLRPDQRGEAQRSSRRSAARAPRWNSKQTRQAEQAPQTTFDRDDPPILGANPFVGLTREQVVASLARLGQRIAVEPGAAAAAVVAFAELLQWPSGAAMSPPPRRPSFTGAVWQQNPVFRRLMQAYLVEAARRTGSSTRSSSTPRAVLARDFAMSLLTEALADELPADQPQRDGEGRPDAGPERRRRARNRVRPASQRRHAVAGRHEALHRRRQPRGHARAGRTPHRRVRADPVRRDRDEGPPAPARGHPAADHQYYITDLAPGRSLVESTVAAGLPYFTLSWRNPTPEQRDWNLDTYAAACHEAIQVACDIAGSDDANVAGVCAGGVTLAALLGHLAATGESSLVNP